MNDMDLERKSKMRTIYVMGILTITAVLLAGGCSTENIDQCALVERGELCTIAFTSNDVGARVSAIEKLNQMDEPGFGYFQILHDGRVDIPVRVEIIKRHHDALTQGQLKELAGVNNIYDVRKVALSYITDKKYLLWVASNKAIDTLAEFAQQRADLLSGE